MLGTKAVAFGKTRTSTRLNARALSLIVAVVALYLLSLHVLQGRLAGLEASMRPLGVHYVLFGAAVQFKLGLKTESMLAVIAVVESILLVVLYRVLEATRRDRIVAGALVLATAAMLFASFQARFTSSDLYHYIFYGKTTSLQAAYTGVAHPAYPAGYGALRLVLSEPVPPSVYGPLWQEGDRLLIRTTHSLASGVQAIRIASALALLLIFASLVALRVRTSLLAIAIVNPALYYMYIVQGHNDIFAVAAILAGLAALRRNNVPIAVALGVAAGLVKVSVVGVALATLCTAGSLRTRIGSAAAMLGSLLACSLIFGGRTYLHAMLFVGSEQTGVESSAFQHYVRLVVQALLGLIAFAAVVASIGFRRVVPTAVFAFPAISGLVHAWYFVWGLPYAFLEQRLAAITITGLPIIIFLCDESLIDAFHVRFTTAVFSIIAIVALAQLYRRKFTLSPEQPATS